MALNFFHKLRQQFRTWNSAPWKSKEFDRIEKMLLGLIGEVIPVRKDEPSYKEAL